MLYTLSIDVESYDDNGQETCHSRGAAIVTRKKKEVIRVAKDLYDIVQDLLEDPSGINTELLYSLCHDMKEFKK